LIFGAVVAVLEMSQLRHAIIIASGQEQDILTFLCKTSIPGRQKEMTQHLKYSWTFILWKKIIYNLIFKKVYHSGHECAHFFLTLHQILLSIHNYFNFAQMAKFMLLDSNLNKGIKNTNMKNIKWTRLNNKNYNNNKSSHITSSLFIVFKGTHLKKIKCIKNSNKQKYTDQYLKWDIFNPCYHCNVM
jgi:hypothetical protein